MIVAIDERGALLDPQPTSTARDGAGCFRGCRQLSCEATLCREFAEIAVKGNFEWRYVDSTQTHVATPLDGPACFYCGLVGSVQRAAVQVFAGDEEHWTLDGPCFLGCEEHKAQAIADAFATLGSPNIDHERWKVGVYTITYSDGVPSLTFCYGARYTSTRSL